MSARTVGRDSDFLMSPTCTEGTKLPHDGFSRTPTQEREVLHAVAVRMISAAE
jgi:hypothetical protein